MEPPSLKPVSKTAFYCCGVRMQDAQSEHPICGDVYAERFMSDEGRVVFDAFKDDTSPNLSNVARHRIVDDILRTALCRHPDLTVVLIGAGFDSRAYRLDGGTWIELDEPAVIAYKNDRLPLASCHNALHRVPIDFATETLADKLAPYAGRKQTIVVVEGVLMYLAPEAIDGLLATLVRTFPSHTLVCDLMTRRFFEKYSRPLHEKIVGLGATFSALSDDPESRVLAHGYRRTAKVSMVARAAALGAFKIPSFLLTTVFRTLANGYAMYTFEV